MEYKVFDLPYLMNRIKMMHVIKLAQNVILDLIQREEIQVRGRPQNVYDLYGITNLDYLDLYRCAYTNKQESYKLDFIKELELGRSKDEMPYDTFKDWYTKDFQSFVDYNIQDVEIVDA